MFAIRGEDTKHWICPWLSYDPINRTYGRSVASHPDSWPLYEARQYVNKQRNKQNQYAVYLIRGYIQQKIWPKGETDEHDQG